MRMVLILLAMDPACARQGLQHFLRRLTIWSRATSRLFDGHDAAAELQQIAHGVARNLYHGFFGDRVTFVVHGDELVDTVLDAA